jgi:hypothetical protein
MNHIVFFASMLGALTAVSGLAMGSYSIAETVLILSSFALAFWCLFEGEQ